MLTSKTFILIFSCLLSCTATSQTKLTRRDTVVATSIQPRLEKTSNDSVLHVVMRVIVNWSGDVVDAIVDDPKGLSPLFKLEMERRACQVKFNAVRAIVPK